MDAVIGHGRLHERVWRPALLTGALLMLGLCALLAVRRLAGALSSPLDGTGFALVAACGVVAAAFYRIVWLAGGQRSLVSIAVEWLLLPSASLLLAAGALTMSATPAWALVPGWLAIVASEAAWWTKGIGLSRRLPPAAAPGPDERVSSPVAAPQEAVVDEEPCLPPGVTQQLTRSFEDEIDTLYGLVRARIQVGERSQQIHVAFCPPFLERPELQAFVVEGLDALVRVAQLESFGARLEIRLPAHAQTLEEVLVEFTARDAR